MHLASLRRHALSLLESAEAPHFEYASFRVRGKIFVTVPPGGEFAHVFVPEAAREAALAMHPDCIEKLTWGAKVVGVRVKLAAAPAALVKDLVTAAWQHKAPKSLHALARQ